MPEDGAFIDYLRRVEETFIGLRGTPFILSPSDVQLIQSWYERGLPPEAVEEGVREVFQRELAKDPERKISSLRYCSFHVELLWRDRRKKRAGTGHREGRTLDTAALLKVNRGRLSDFLKSGAFPKLAGKKETAWLKTIEALGDKGGDVEAVEAGLKELQDAVAAAVWSSLPKPERETRENLLRKKLDKDLAPLSLPAQKLLVKTLLMETLMEEFRLPRLTLLE